MGQPVPARPMRAGRELGVATGPRPTPMAATLIGPLSGCAANRPERAALSKRPLDPGTANRVCVGSVPIRDRTAGWVGGFEGQDADPNLLLIGTSAATLGFGLPPDDGAVELQILA